MRTLILGTSLVVLLASNSHAQGVCSQENAGPTFNDGSFMGPSGITAARVVAVQAMSVTGAEVFSGEVAGAARVAIWTDDAVNGQPGTVLASGDFALAAALGFQGADFHAPVPIAAGQTFWVAWSLPFVSQSPLDAPKASLGQFYRTSLDAGLTWFGPFQFNNSHFKFRLRGPCGPCDGFTTASGPGCNGIAGVPMLTGGGCPAAGHAVTARIDRGPPGATAILTLGFGTASGPLAASCSLANLPLAPLVIPLALDAQGSIALAGVIPPGSPPADVYLQAVIADSAMFVGFSATNALQVAIR